MGILSRKKRDHWASFLSGNGSREVACDHDFPQLNHRDDHGRIRGVDFELLQAVFNGQPRSQR